MNKTHFNEQEIKERLIFFPDWTYDAPFLVKHYKFQNFLETFAFVTQVAILSEKLNHHPDMFVGYNTLTLKIMTHDHDGITHKDFQWIEKINQIPHKNIDF